MHFKRSSAICFNVDQPKILSSGNGLMLYHTIKEGSGERLQGHHGPLVVTDFVLYSCSKTNSNLFADINKNVLKEDSKAFSQLIAEAGKRMSKVSCAGFSTIVHQSPNSGQLERCLFTKYK